jgi:dipeptidyl-peptidase III
MKKLFIMSLLTAIFGSSACDSAKKAEATEPFHYVVDQFADLQILRYQVPGFKELNLKQKELIYYLNQAALEGIDILYDQNYKHNLCIKRTLEAIYTKNGADTTSADWKAMEVYLKRVWASNGIHHHYGCDKFIPGFSKVFFCKGCPFHKSRLPASYEGRNITGTG